MKSQENLKSSFAGESQANRKYTAFAEKAEKEGFAKVARLFRAVAEAETIHALRQLHVMGAVKNTAENLQAALEGETYEFTVMYPEFIAEAEKEGVKEAKMAFHLANEAEKEHGKLFEKALAAVKEGSDFPAEGFALCPVCGYVAENEAPERCPICNTPGEKFRSF